MLQERDKTLMGLRVCRSELADAQNRCRLSSNKEFFIFLGAVWEFGAGCHFFIRPCLSPCSVLYGPC